MGKKKKKEEVKVELEPRDLYYNDLKEYIGEVIRGYVNLIPNVRLFLTYWMEEKENDKGSAFSVRYEPNSLAATFYIYDGLFDDIPDEGLTDGFKNYVKYCLAHEVGHCIIWELDGRHDIVEKTATIVGVLLMRLYEYEYEGEKKEE